MQYFLLIVGFGLILVSCESQYRYPCQDPQNWEKTECRRPACLANGECADMLTDGLSDDSNTKNNEIFPKE